MTDARSSANDHFRRLALSGAAALALHLLFGQAVREAPVKKAPPLTIEVQWVKPKPPPVDDKPEPPPDEKKPEPPPEEKKPEKKDEIRLQTSSLYKGEEKQLTSPLEVSLALAKKKAVFHFNTIEFS